MALLKGIHIKKQLEHKQKNIATPGRSTHKLDEDILLLVDVDLAAPGRWVPLPGTRGIWEMTLTVARRVRFEIRRQWSSTAETMESTVAVVVVVRRGWGRKKIRIQRWRKAWRECWRHGCRGRRRSAEDMVEDDGAPVVGGEAGLVGAAGGKATGGDGAEAGGGTQDEWLRTLIWRCGHGAVGPWIGTLSGLWRGEGCRYFCSCVQNLAGLMDFVGLL